MAIIVRVAEEADQEALEVVRDSATSTLRETYRPNQAALHAARASIDDQQCLVAEMDARLVGVVRYYVEDDKLSMLGLGVLKEARHKGVARALLDSLMTTAKKLGLCKVSLWCVEETGNVEIFRRLGFCEIEHKTSELFESDQHTTLTEVRMEIAV